MLRRRFLWTALAGALLAAATAAAVSTLSSTGASARAIAIRIYPAGQERAGTVQVAAPPDGAVASEPFAFPQDGSVASAASTSASVSASADGEAAAGASAELTDVKLFGGEITISHVLARANASATIESAGGDTLQTAIEGLVVLGQPVALAANARIELGDWGYMRTLLSTTGGGDPGAVGNRQSLRAIDIVLTRDHGGLVSGSEIIIGWVEAFAQASSQEETVTLPRSGPNPETSTQAEKTSTNKKKPKKGKGDLTKPIPRGLQPKLTAKGYVFPVYGSSTAFSDSFLAPRADTGWHHGVDIFAPTGTPVLSVATGTVFSVGWNDLGGNRFWLRDRKGNEFYYAHLSAFSPLAVNRTRVRAGAVIGFVGNSGDAITTPPHLHFEVHPASLLGLGYDRSSVDPYSWLVALRHLRDIRFPNGTAEWLKQLAPQASTHQPGAVLLHAADISTLPRLDEHSLRRLLTPLGAKQEPIIDRA